jgi:pimeloyl-ACP methyl ester carboxylesterase
VAAAAFPGAARDAARGEPVSEPRERSVTAGGLRARVWEKGEGEPVAFLGGLRGLPRWPEVLDRLAERRRVVAPSLPGFPGGVGHERLDSLADWVTATLDLIDAAGLEGADWVGASLGATLALEAAAFSRASVRRLAVIAPFGLFDEREPVADPWAVRHSQLAALLSAEPERLEAFLACPEDGDEVEWQIMLTRASEAAARLLWPIPDLGTLRRLHRVRAPTLLLWGSGDRLIPASYAKRFAEGIAGWVEIRSLDGAGHMAEIDRPDAVADAILAFLER